MHPEKIAQFVKHAPYVKEIISPWHTLSISGIFYVRIYPDGSIINLANNIDWTNLYFDKLKVGDYQTEDVALQLFNDFEVILWTFNAQNPIWQDAKNYFGYRNGVLISEEHTYFREIIAFYSNAEDQAMNHFYVNKLDMLQKMKQHFKVQAKDLIQQAEIDRQESRVFVFPSMVSKATLKDQQEQSMTVMHKEHGTLIKLPNQRGKCFIHLLNGKSIKEIASLMQLSPKTIEHYLEILRKDLGCRNSKDLISSYAKQLDFKQI